jgi:hypothetical protein
VPALFLFVTPLLSQDIVIAKESNYSIVISPTGRTVREPFLGEKSRVNKWYAHPVG